MRKPLTQRQHDIYAFVVREIRERGIPPTIREIGDEFGMRSSNGAREALNAIARKGYVRRLDRLSRGIELVEPIELPGEPASARKIPVLKALPPGSTAVGRASSSRQIAVDASLVPSDANAFAVRVSDDSLRESGFRSGDLVVVIANGRPESSCYVVAEVSSKLVVRRYVHSENGLVLQSDTDEMPSPDGSSSDVRLVGSVCGLVRSVSAVE